jgi:hypothetical protein
MIAKPDISFGGIDIGDDPQAERDPRRSDAVIPSARLSGVPHTLSRAIGQLKGKTITVTNPRQFAKAIHEIDQSARRARR